MVVRREALDRVGGWSPTAITEDLELSTRLAGAGEHVALAPDVVIREEAVPWLPALWTQRLRWAEGSIRRLMEGGRQLLASSAPLSRKLDFLAFTGEFVIPPLFATSVVAAVVTVRLPADANWTIPITFAGAYALGIFFLQAAGLAAVGVRGGPLLGRSIRGALFLLHWLVVIPVVLLRIVVAPPSATFSKTPRVGHRV
jgi:1,2-diacylglycerol 3-beta-glucosyltransferase